MRRINIFNVSMDVATIDETVDFISDRISKGKFTQHVVVNVAKLVNVQKDNILSESVNGCDIINIDGMGVVWAARLLGHYVPERVAGIDLFIRLVGMAEIKKIPIFLLGADEVILDRVVCVISKKYRSIDIAGFHHGYFWNDEERVVTMIKKSGAKMLFVAISSPLKENFINKWRNKLGVTFVMGVGGTFDVIAGHVNRAPIWMQQAGLEWMYRVFQEPRRMWRRYLTTNSRFAVMLFGAWVRRRG
jgi:N-acetylglucosaminyldiphosphoundecaprenol N-acetyl-beta-D-mannosaminyltransferase